MTNQRPPMTDAIRRTFTKTMKTVNGNRSWHSIPTRINAANVAVHGTVTATLAVRAAKGHFCIRNRAIRRCKYNRWNWSRKWTIMSESNAGLWCWGLKCPYILRKNDRRAGIHLPAWQIRKTFRNGNGWNSTDLTNYAVIRLTVSKRIIDFFDKWIFTDNFWINFLQFYIRPRIH